MKTLQILLLTTICFLATSTKGQNWQMVKNGNRPYFMSPNNTTFPHKTNLLATISLDSTVVNANLDSVYYFTNTGMRLHNNYYCIPQNGASMLGAKCIMQNNGDTYFVMHTGDSILVKTNANVNDTWVLGTNDTITITATIAATLYSNIGSAVSDSIKIITLSNNSNGGLSNNYFTDTLVISKNHGIVKMSSIPSYLGIGNSYYGDYFLLQTNGLQQTNMGEDIFWKYKPGNVFQMALGSSPFDIPNNAIVTDSVIAVQPYGNDLVVYFQRQGKVTKNPNLVFNGGTSGGWGGGGGGFVVTDNAFRWLDTLIIDTIIASTNNVTLSEISFPNQMDVIQSNGNNDVKILYHHQAARMLCDSLVLFTQEFKFINAIENDSTNCYMEVIPVKPVTENTLDSNITAVISKFGDLNIENMVGMGNGRFIYFRINGCEFGTREEIFPLSVFNTSNQVANLKVFPNPCNNQCILDIKNTQNVEVVLVNILGQNFKIVTKGNVVNTQNIANGLYTLQLNDNNRLWQTKLYVQH